MDLGNAMPPPTDRLPGSALFPDGARTALFDSPKGDFMLYSTMTQPIDEDLVQRLREKGGL